MRNAIIHFRCHNFCLKFEGEYREDYDLNKDGIIDVLDSVWQMQIEGGLRNPDGTPVTQTDTATEETKPWWAIKGYTSLDAALASGVYDADGNKIKDTYIDVDDEYQDEPQPTVSDTATESDLSGQGQIDDGSGGGYTEENGNGKVIWEYYANEFRTIESDIEGELRNRALTM